MTAERTMASPTMPRYVLSLDDLPFVMEADGRVHPVYMRPRDVARLFDISTNLVRSWVTDNGLPALRVGSHLYIEVPALKAWIEERTAAYRAATMQSWDADEASEPESSSHADA